jgi:tight adherence protein B
MKSLTRLGGLVVLAAAIWVAAASAAGTPRIVEAGGTVFPQRAYILSLPKPKVLTTANVLVTENGARVSGETVARQGTSASKTAVVLAIDASASMQGKPIAGAVAAARAFAAQMNPDEQVAVVAFNNVVHVIQPFTSDPKQVADALATPPKLAVGTKIYDAIEESLKQIAVTTNPNASIILLSDGTDVGSVAKRKRVMHDLAASHVRVFSVGLDSKSYSPKTLASIADASKGSYLEALGPAQLKPIFQTIGQQLASEYRIEYQSHANPHTTVTVAMKVKGVPGIAASSYTTPVLRVVPAPPYHLSSVDKVIQSKWLFLAVAISVAVLIGFVITYALSGKDQRLVDRVGDFVSVQRPGGPDPSRPVAATTTPGRESLLARVKVRTSRSNWSERLAETLELADIETDPLQFLIISTVATLVVMTMLYLVRGVLGALIGLIVPFVIRWIVLRRVKKKRMTFAEQLPDNLDVLASALRSGHSLVGALTVVADDAAEPSRGEFRRVLAEEQFGAQLEDAFKVTVDRMKSQDLDQVALVARLQREMGSNSAEVLDKVIDTVRGRMELRRLVSTLTAQGRLSRLVLTLLPIGIAIVLTLLSPSYMHPLFHERVGQALLVLAALMVVAGSYLIGKIVDIEV